MGKRTPHSLEQLGGPSKHTIEKILRGERVTEPVLQRLVRALKTSRKYIPDN